MFNYRRYVSILLSVIFTSLLATACTPSGENIAGETWVIFSAEKASEARIGEWFVTDSGTIDYWTPTQSDILRLENGFTPYLQANPDGFYTTNPPIWERLTKYNRQYIGLIMDGRQIIYANYFCNNIGTDWKSHFVFVLDGGECYFQFKYDIGSGDFFDLQVNGEA